MKSINRNDVKVGEGIFVINQAEFNKLNLNDHEKKIIVKYLDPNDVDSFCISSQKNKYLIYADKFVKTEILKNPIYKNLKTHLEFYGDFITSSNKPFGLHRPREKKYFERKKILFKGMFKENEFTIDTAGFYVGMSFISIIEKQPDYNLEFLLGILNSKYAKHWFFIYGKKRGGGVDIGVDKLRSFPLPEYISAKIVSIVNKILSDKKEGKSTSDLEKALDFMVFKLYQLSYEEIKTIAPESKITVAEYEAIKID